MQIPSRLTSGMPFRQGVVSKINSIIEYLRSQRVVGDNNTIQVCQGVNGMTIKAVQHAVSSGKSSFDHPFKLFISVDENDNQQVSVKPGDFYIQGQDYYKYINFNYDKNSEYFDPQYCQPYIPVDWQEVEEGDYIVVAVVQDFFDEGGTTPDDILTKGVCFVAPYEPYTVPNVPGFTSIPIGFVTKTDVEDEQSEATYSLSVKEQLVLSDLMIDDFNRFMPWAINFVIQVKEKSEECNGLLIPENTKIEWAYCRSGRLYFDNDYYIVEDEDGITPQTSGDFSNLLDDGMYFAVLSEDHIFWTNDAELLVEIMSKKNMVLGYFMVQNGCFMQTQCINNDLQKDEKTFPFMLYFGADEQTGQMKLKIVTGQVYYITSTYYLLNFSDELIDVDLDALQPGRYGVIGAVAYNYDQNILEPKIFVVDEDVTTHDIPNVTGFRTFAIGSFTKEVPSSSSQEQESGEQPQPIYFPGFQFTDNNFTLEDKYFDLPFCAVCQIQANIEEGEIITDKSDLELTKVLVSKGKVYQENTRSVIEVEDQGEDPGQGTNYCYLVRTKGNKEGDWTNEIEWVTSAKTHPFEPIVSVASSGGQISTLPKEINTYNILLATVRNGQMIDAENYHPSDFIFDDAEKFKVKVNGDATQGFTKMDEKPGYLHDKLLSDRFENIASSTWPTIGNNPLPGFIYVEGKEPNDGDNQMFMRWDYPQIQGFDQNKYLQLNMSSSVVKWQEMGRVRTTSADMNPDFIENKIVGVDPISSYVESDTLKISANVSDFIREITTSDCLSAVKTSSTSSGSIWNVELDKDCVFENFNISGTDPIAVTGSGQNWNVGFSGSVISSVTGTNCISATKNGGAVTVSLDKNCVFQDFNINGTSPVNVTGSGNSWNVALNDSDFVKNVTGTNCISASKNGATVNVTLDKACVFQGFNINGTSPINVTGSGQSWNVGFDDTGFVKNVTGNNCITASKSGNAVTVSLDKSCVFQDFSITGGKDISVTGNGNNWSISYTGSGGSGGADVEVTGTFPIEVTSTGTSSSKSFNVGLNTSGLITGVSATSCISANVTSGIANISLDKNCVFESFTIGGENGIHVLNDDGQNNQTWTISLDVNGNGILMINNGSLSVIPSPQGNAVLTCIGGSIQWVPFSDCESACN